MTGIYSWTFGKQGIAQPVSTSSYSTTFPNTENPFSDGSKWKMGLADGIDWNNFQTTPGLAFASAAQPSGFADCIGCLKTSVGVSSTKHFARSTVKRLGGYTPTDTHEAELHVGCSIVANSIFSYECDVQFGTSILFVRWAGTVGTVVPYGTGNWTDTPIINGSFSDAQDGDVIEFRYDLNDAAAPGVPVVSLLVNSVVISKVADSNAPATLKAGGQPGMGMFVRDTTSANWPKYCWKTKFEAGGF